MNKETRIKKIEKIEKKTEKSKAPLREEIYWKINKLPLVVCEIPLGCLIYNKYNGRILSRTKSLESQNQKIDVETDEGKKLIEKLLWESKEGRNKTTLADLKEKGQLKTGIITKDGIIIDGNRRAMLLNKLDKYDYFRTVVLPVELEDDPIEIEKLETTYQMGEDEKLGYNPIEKYLKAKGLYQKLKEQYKHDLSIKKIAKWMGEKDTEIELYLEVVDIIDRYLEYHKYDGIYAMADTKNDGKEDLFLFVRKWMATFQNKDSNKGFDGYKQSDVDDLEAICFDYIRAKIGKSYDGKNFRIIADGMKKNHFFGNKKVWKMFNDYHSRKIEPNIDKVDNEIPVNYESSNLEAHLSDRDGRFRDYSLDDLRNNMRKCTTSLNYDKASDKPIELVTDAGKAIDAIDPKQKLFSEPEVQDKIENLLWKIVDMLKDKSVATLFIVVIRILESIDIKNISGTENVELEKIKQINKISFDIKKRLGG